MGEILIAIVIMCNTTSSYKYSIEYIQKQQKKCVQKYLKCVKSRGELTYSGKFNRCLKDEK